MEDQNMGEDKKSTERPRGAYALSMFKLPFHNYGPLLHYIILGLTDTTTWST
jgi:hypothetical protein